ncbi:MAG TPA: protein kinase [Planctomycetaceae bacterium]|nr:protein kinase [Planctomycetaceae bacterium]
MREYLERVDRGEVVDREEFLMRHAPISDQLRSFIAAEDEVRKLAGAEPAFKRSHDSTESLAGHGQETVAPQSAGKGAVEKERAALGARFGRYRIICALGKGAMGTVYLAEDTQIERQVALKTPHFTEDPTGEQKERFFREARAAGNLRHPNICPIYDFGEIDGKHFITMAYIEGHLLSALIRPEPPRSERQILIAIRKLALALQEAHDHGIVHRDLKPSNIMVDKKDEPIIMDFGLAQQDRRDGDARLTQAGTVLGTPAFMSPEQVEGDPAKIGPTTDQYSLGVILYELLTGQLPFAGPIITVMRQSLTKEPTHPSQLRPNLDLRIEAVCLKMMAKTPLERFPSMTAVAGEIAAILDNPAAKLKPAERDREAGTSDTALCTLRPASSPAPSAVSDRMLTGFATTQVVKRVEPTVVSDSKRRSWIAWCVLALGLAVLGAMWAVMVVYFHGTAVVVEINAPGIEVTVNEAAITVKGPGKEEIKVEPGEQSLKITYAGLETITKTFALKRGDKKVLTVSLADAKLTAKLGNEVFVEQAVKSASAGPGVKPPQSVAQSPPDDKTKDTPATARSSDPDRTAAEWVLSIGGTVRINEGRQDLEIKTADGLPRRAFDLTEARLDGTAKATDAGLACFKDCKNLTSLNLWGSTQVSDAGLVYFKDCKNLTSLILNSTRVSDAGLAYFKDCKNLRALALTKTHVSDAGLAYFKDCKDLTQLHLYLWGGTQVSDAGLAYFKDCKNLTSLILNGAQVSDAGLAYFKDCKNLTMLDLWGSTQVSDAGVAYFKDRKNLTTLILNGTRVSDVGLAYFKDCKGRLTALGVGAHVTDAGLVYFKNCNSLTHLNLYESTQVSDAGLVHFKDCKSLTFLNLFGTQVTDAGLDYFRQCKNLDELNLQNTKVTGASLAHLKDWPKLTHLCLVNQPVSDATLANLTDGKNLTGLELIAETISDAGLVHMQNCETLTSLFVGTDKITDAGLVYLKMLTKLENLKLYNTRVSDAGLEHLVPLTKLTWLDLRESKSVTDEGVKKLAAALPNCKIEWDGGVVGPAPNVATR